MKANLLVFDSFENIDSPKNIPPKEIPYKVILSDPEQKHKTMIEISGDCGFNSTATDNSFFKKLVGSTPTQYRAENLPK